MIIRTVKTAIFKPKENLLAFISHYVPCLIEGEVLVVTSKIVALSEGRFRKMTDLKGKEKIIRAESKFALKTKWAYLTIKDDLVMANAGVDESNGNGQIILLPQDSFKSASKIRNFFKKKYKLKNLGVIITDSHIIPLRVGVSGVALGYAGFQGLKDYRQKVDIFNRPFHLSCVNVSDSLATAAVFCMGEGKERRPLAIISGVSLAYINRVNPNELKIDIRDDMYSPLFRKIE